MPGLGKSGPSRMRPRRSSTLETVTVVWALQLRLVAPSAPGESRPMRHSAAMDAALPNVADRFLAPALSRSRALALWRSGQLPDGAARDCPRLRFRPFAVMVGNSRLMG